MTFPSALSGSRNDKESVLGSGTVWISHCAILNVVGFNVLPLCQNSRQNLPTQQKLEAAISK